MIQSLKVKINYNSVKQKRKVIFFIYIGPFLRLSSPESLLRVFIGSSCDPGSLIFQTTWSLNGMKWHCAHWGYSICEAKGDVHLLIGEKKLFLINLKTELEFRGG